MRRAGAIAAMAIAACIAAAGVCAAAAPDADSAAHADAAARRAARADADLAKEGWCIDSVRVSGADEPGFRAVRASARMAVPASSVWGVLSGSVRSEHETWPGIKESILESVSGDTITKRYVVAVPVFKDRRYRLKTVCNASVMQAVFWSVPGYGNVRGIHGSWTVTALADSLTRVDYAAHIDPGMKLVPGFIVSWATKRAVPRLFGYIHDRAAHRTPTN